MEDTILIARRFVNEVWNDGNPDAVEDYVDPHCRLCDSLTSKVVFGADKLKDYVRACRNAFPDLNVTIRHAFREGKEVVVHWTAQGTQDGTFFGISPSHKKASVCGVAILKFEGDKIVEQWADRGLHSVLANLWRLETRAGAPH